MKPTPSSALAVPALAVLLLLGACAGTAGTAGTSGPGVRTGTSADSAIDLEAAKAQAQASPEDPDAWFQLGVAWQHQTDTATLTRAKAYQDSALASFDAALERDPGHVRALVHRGLVLEDLERRYEALEMYRSAARVAPEDPLPYINLGSLLYFGFQKTYEAKEALTKALELDPENPDAHFNLGVLFADARLFQEARAEWEKVLEVDPDGPAGTLAQENLDRVVPLLEPTAADSGQEETAP